MKKKRILLLLILALLLGLSACGDDTPISTGTGPGRMVRRIEVAIHPADSNFSRTYVTQENMNDMLALLRTMSSKKYPETEPVLDGSQTYYTATVTFANGEQSLYYLLSHTYLRIGQEPWCLVDRDLSLQFNEFLRTRPSDDGSMPVETTAPAQTTAPTE